MLGTQDNLMISRLLEQEQDFMDKRREQETVGMLLHK